MQSSIESPPLESLIPLTEAAKILPGRPDHSTVWRWVLSGTQGTRLRAWRFGRKWYTNEAALKEFSQILAARSIESRNTVSAVPMPPKTRSDARRAADIEAAKSVLRAEGCLR